MPDAPFLPRHPKPERGDRLELTTESLAFEGSAVARREDGYVVFVEGAIGGERVVAEIKKAKGNFAEAKLVEILEAGSERRVPICHYFGMCGGCALQHLAYDAQLRAKKQQVIDLFERIGKIHTPPVQDVLPAPNEFHYRNKMEFSFSNERWLTEEEIMSGDIADRFALGLHVRERFNRVIDTKVCYLPNPIVTDILAFTRQFVRDYHIEVYDSSQAEGATSEEIAGNGAPANPNDTNPNSHYVIRNFLRFLVIKTSHATGEVMVNLVTSREEPDLMAFYAKELVQAIPQVTTVVNNINSKRSQVAMGQHEVIYYGEGIIRDTIADATYRISANSFFQANTPQAERLYETAVDYAELRPDDEVWDLYCGTGTISLYAARRVKHVLGIEIVESAVADARANAMTNGIRNVDFIAGDLKAILKDPASVQNDGGARLSPTALIIDPPRSGMHPDVIHEILMLAPSRISYISCNPATQARDVALLAERYDLLELQPVDMFPQTFHIECVAKLRLRP